MSISWPFDELKPVSCVTRNPKLDPRGDLDDVLGGFGLTLIDSLDTLVLMDEIELFKQGARLYFEHFTNYDFDVDVSVFETNIRVLGGLLSCHFLCLKHFDGSEYNNQFLDLSVDLANRLLPAFSTPTGLPFHKVNLRKGLIPNLTPINCLAGIGSLSLEWRILSLLTQNPVYYETTHNCIVYLFNKRDHQTGLLPGLVNVYTGDWASNTATIGPGSDSFFEYLLKNYILFNDLNYLNYFEQSYFSILKYLKKDIHYWEVFAWDGNIAKTEVSPQLTSFWPGVQVLSGDIYNAEISFLEFYSIMKNLNLTFLPEVFNFREYRIHPFSDTSDIYFLRPEFIESIFYLYSASNSPFYLDISKLLFKDILELKTPCGVATVKGLSRTLPRSSKKLEDRLDSFFLGETLKYLYLIFDKNNTFGLKSEHYLFSTEGHPFHIGEIQRLENNKTFDLFNTEPGGVVKYIVSEGTCGLYKPKYKSFRKQEAFLRKAGQRSEIEEVTKAGNFLVQANNQFFHLSTNPLDPNTFITIKAVGSDNAQTQDYYFREVDTDSTVDGSDTSLKQGRSIYGLGGILCNKTFPESSQVQEEENKTETKIFALYYTGFHFCFEEGRIDIDFSTFTEPTILLIERGLCTFVEKMLTIELYYKNYLKVSNIEEEDGFLKGVIVMNNQENGPGFVMSGNIDVDVKDKMLYYIKRLEGETNERFERRKKEWNADIEEKIREKKAVDVAAVMVSWIDREKIKEMERQGKKITIEKASKQGEINRQARHEEGQDEAVVEIGGVEGVLAEGIGASVGSVGSVFNGLIQQLGVLRGCNGNGCVLQIDAAALQTQMIQIQHLSQEEEKKILTGSP